MLLLPPLPPLPLPLTPSLPLPLLLLSPLISPPMPLPLPLPLLIAIPLPPLLPSPLPQLMASPLLIQRAARTLRSSLLGATTGAKPESTKTSITVSGTTLKPRETANALSRSSRDLYLYEPKPIGDQVESYWYTRHAQRHSILVSDNSTTALALTVIRFAAMLIFVGVLSGFL